MDGKRTLSENLRSVDDFPDIRGPVVTWCHEAADEIERLNQGLKVTCDHERRDAAIILELRAEIEKLRGILAKMAVGALQSASNAMKSAADKMEKWQEDQETV